MRENQSADGVADQSHLHGALSAATRAFTNGKFAAVRGTSVSKSGSVTKGSVRSAGSMCFRLTGSGLDRSLRPMIGVHAGHGEPHGLGGRPITSSRLLTAAASADWRIIDCCAERATWR